MDWSDGPAFIGWGGEPTPEQRRRWNTDSVLIMIGCGGLLLAVVGVFMAGLYTIGRWLF